MAKSRRFAVQLADAARGVALVARGERNFRRQLAAGAAVVAAAALLRCDAVEWCLLLGCCGAVLSAEAFNAALETLFHALDDAVRRRMTGCLDRAAGAVLIASAASALIGSVILGGRAWRLLAP